MVSTLCILIHLKQSKSIVLKPHQKFCLAWILTQQNCCVNNDVFEHIYTAPRKKCTSLKAWQQEDTLWLQGASD